MSNIARLENRLAQAVDRFERVEARLGAATDGAEIVRLGQEHAELKPLAEAIAALNAKRAEIVGLEAMVRDSAGDKEMAALAEEELRAAKDDLPALEQAALLLLAPKDKDESASAILEVRAGTGGDEAALFAGDLLRQINGSCQVSFVKASSYNGMASSGQLKTLIGIEESLFNRDIIIVEDIVDTGLTLQRMLDELGSLGARSVEVATLLRKRTAREKGIQVKYVGLELEDEFVVGYGLDYEGLGRNLTDLYKAHPRA